MNRREFLMGSLAINLAGFLPSTSKAAAQAQSVGTQPAPNLIFILVDDMGFSDLGCFGGEIDTPHLDRLASEGIRFTQMHNDAMCVASRSSLLSGKWWPRAGMGIRQGPTVPELLREQGYRNGIIGKWHLNGNPVDRGFDYFFGMLGGFADHFTGHPSYRLNKEPFTDFGPDYFSTTAFTDHAVDFIRTKDADKEKKPFFLYLNYQAPHNPLQAPREDIMKYRGKYLDGWQAIREARYQRQKALGIVAPEAALPSYPQNLPEWDTLSDAQKSLEDLRMAVYAAMVEGIDQGVGRVVEALEEEGIAEDTLIIFCSDNGTDSFHVLDQAMLERELLPGDPGSNWQPGTGWAYASVTPWRLYKISKHSGGVVTGTVAWWPKGIAQPGRVDHSPLHFVDILPTFMALFEEASGAKTNWQNQVEHPAGQSFVPLFENKAWQREQPMYFQFADNRAFRNDKYTLVEVDDAGWELYRSDDYLEVHDLAEEMPEIVAELEAQWLDWWRTESGEDDYTPKRTEDSPHYQPQGDRGSGVLYQPTAMPASLADRYPLPEG